MLNIVILSKTEFCKKSVLWDEGDKEGGEEKNSSVLTEDTRTGNLG